MTFSFLRPFTHWNVTKLKKFKKVRLELEFANDKKKRILLFSGHMTFLSSWQFQNGEQRNSIWIRVVISLLSGWIFLILPLPLPPTDQQQRHERLFSNPAHRLRQSLRFTASLRNRVMNSQSSWNRTRSTFVKPFLMHVYLDSERWVYLQQRKRTLPREEEEGMIT